MEEKYYQNIEIILDYSGEKIKNHTMDLKEFANSLNGFYDLLRIVANKNGLKDEEIKIEIKNVDEGSIKAILIFCIGVISTHYLEAILTKFDNTAIKIYNDLTKSIKDKKKISNQNDLKNFRVIENLSNTDLFGDINFHKAVRNFSYCLNEDVENINIKTNCHNLEELNIDRSEKENLLYIPESRQIDETLKEEEMILYLDGIQGSIDKWHFFRKENDKKVKMTAQVLSTKLLEFGKETSYTDYSNIPLYCKVMIKTFLKEGNKKRSKEYYITNCDFEEKMNLLNYMK